MGASSCFSGIYNLVLILETKIYYTPLASKKKEMPNPCEDEIAKIRISFVTAEMNSPGLSFLSLMVSHD